MTRMLPSNATVTREEASGTYHRTDGPVNVAPDAQLRHRHAGGTNQRPAFRGASAASDEMTREYYPFRSSEDERQRLIARRLALAHPDGPRPFKDAQASAVALWPANRRSR